MKFIAKIIGWIRLIIMMPIMFILALIFAGRTK